MIKLYSTQAVNNVIITKPISQKAYQAQRRPGLGQQQVMDRDSKENNPTHNRNRRPHKIKQILQPQINPKVHPVPLHINMSEPDVVINKAPVANPTHLLLRH